MKYLLVLFTLLFSVQGLTYQEENFIEIVSDNLPQNGQLPTDMVSSIFMTLYKKIPQPLPFRFIQASRKREWRELEDNNNVCLTNKIKTENREAIAHFAEYPITVFPPNRIVIRHSQNKNIPSKLSLSEAIEVYRLRIGITEGRSYGDRLDKEIKRLKQSLVVVAGETAEQRLRLMLQNNRIDALIEYSAVILADTNIVDIVDSLTVHSIEEAPNYVYGYIACSKSTLGKKFITQINAAIKKQKNNDYIIAEHAKIFSRQEIPFIASALQEVHDAVNIANQ